MEMPECPVCLQAYDAAETIPRVLSCGHSACESCIAQLSSSSSARSFPDTIRCPACNQVVRCPRSQGPAALPKNIDLLRLFPPSSPSRPLQSKAKPEPSPPSHADFFPLPWNDQLFATWKDWILPSDVISVASVTRAPPATEAVVSVTASTSSLSSVRRDWCLRENQPLSLLPVGDASSSSSLSAGSDRFELSYTARVMGALSRLSDKVRAELGFIVAASSGQRRVLCKVYGLWMNLSEDNSLLFLVCERFHGDLSDLMKERDEKSVGASADDLFTIGVMGMELCEAVMGLHAQGVVCGFLAPCCFCFDGCGHCLLDLNSVLLAGRSVRRDIMEARRRDDHSSPSKIQAFVNPELRKLLRDESGVSDCGIGVSYGSDVWSLACILVMLLVGDAILCGESLEGIHDGNFVEKCLDRYNVWTKEVVSALEASLAGTPFESLLHILESCLSYDPGNRPHVSDIWRCFRGLFVKPQCTILAGLDVPVVKESSICCLVSGDLCSLPRELGNISHSQDRDVILGNDNTLDDLSSLCLVGSSGRDIDHFQSEEVGEHFIKGLNVGSLKSVTLQGHRDCITSLAIGGGFLLSSSFDKMVHVWSLQDFSLVQSLRGHEHRIMAILFVDARQPLCISGDSGGWIFAWHIGNSIDKEPLKKWYDHNDWRYSGVHSLAVSGSQCLYSGSGDKSIKAWSLQDYSLTCTMTGHKSVVSSLVVSDGILYSGSWDGTVRLWWLNDHSPLAVLEDDTSVTGTSILSLSVEDCLLVASYDNGFLKMWQNEVLLKSMQIQSGAIFALHRDGKWLFTGGWDKIIHIQEFSENDFQMGTRAVGSISCDSVITSLLHWQGKLFVGFSNKDIKVYYHEDAETRISTV